MGSLRNLLAQEWQKPGGSRRTERVSVHGLGQRAWLRAASGEGTRLKWSLRGKGAGSDGVSGMNTEQGERLRTRLSAEDQGLS